MKLKRENVHKKQCHYDSHFESFLVPCRLLWRPISDRIGSEQATRGSTAYCSDSRSPCYGYWICPSIRFHTSTDKGSH